MMRDLVQAMGDMERLFALMVERHRGAKVNHAMIGRALVDLVGEDGAREVCWAIGARCEQGHRNVHECKYVLENALWRFSRWNQGIAFSEERIPEA